MFQDFDNVKSKLLNLATGHHGCFFYQSFTEAIEVTVAFLQIGLERNEQSIYLADPLCVEKVRKALIHFGIDVRTEEQNKRLILSSERGYLNDGHFDKDKMVNFLDQAFRQSLKDGFSGLRATGDVIWEIGNDRDMEKLAEYERVLDTFLLYKKITGLCQYNIQAMKGENLRGALFCHNAVVKELEVYVQNPFYNSPHLFPQTSFERMCQSFHK
jgi:hypothetical protein